MSEPLLKAILRLFAAVAKEDEVTHHEREQIRIFLQDHVSRSAVDSYLAFFDAFIQTLPPKTGGMEGERKLIESLCAEVGPELTQKQKIVILLELMNIVQADGSISEHEEDLVKAVGTCFKIASRRLRRSKYLYSEPTPHTWIMIIFSSSIPVQSTRGRPAIFVARNSMVLYRSFL